MDYLRLAELYQQLSSTTKRLQKTHILASFLRQAKQEELAYLLLLLRGKVFPDWDERKVGIAERLVLKAINVTTGSPIPKLESAWSKSGDLGQVAEQHVEKKQQSTLFSQSLTVKKVFTNLQKLASLEGKGTVDRKIKLVSELLSQGKPLEARYIIRTVLEDLRVGVGDGSIRDAIAWAYLTDPHFDEKTLAINPPDRTMYQEALDAVQGAFDKCNDWGRVAEAAAEGKKALKEIKMTPGVPVKVMLAQKVNSITHGFERVGRPAAIEYKYDGFRMLVNKAQGRITIFTRRLENVTKQFPDVVQAVKSQVKADAFILDGEGVGFDPKTKKYLPFQHISQRIRRKYDIQTLRTQLPVELNVFDILYLEGKTLIEQPFSERRKLLEKIITPKERELVLADQLRTDKEKEAEQFYKESLSKGNEGVMFKHLEGAYKPGSRVGVMVKLKPVKDAFDLVIVGAEWGEGKRSGWLTSFTLACRDEDDRLYGIGKVGTGVKELENEAGDVTFGKLTDLLKPLIQTEKGKAVTVRPGVVLEIAYEELQKSPSYSSGYALRFPRVLKLRDDRGVHDITGLDEVQEAYDLQQK